MAYYTTSNLMVNNTTTYGGAPWAITQPVAGGFQGGSTNTGGTVWTYKSSDPITTVIGSSYFSNGFAIGMRVSDTVMVLDTVTPALSFAFVSAVTTAASGSQTGGGATLSTLCMGTTGAGVR